MEARKKGEKIILKASVRIKFNFIINNKSSVVYLIINNRSNKRIKIFRFC